MNLSKEQSQVLAALNEQHVETRRPVRSMIVQAACNARSAAARDAVLMTLARLKRHGLVEQCGSDWMPTDLGRASAAGGCHCCGSVPGQFHAPECSAVNAFQAGRIGEEAGASHGQPASPAQAPDVEESRTSESVAPIDTILLERCSAMTLLLLAQAKLAHEKGDPAALGEIAWLQETARQIEMAGGVHG